jgi:hypothetical protein
MFPAIHTCLLVRRCFRSRCSEASAEAMADEDEYVEAFVQGEDSALLAQIKAREAACAPLLKYAWHGT